MEPTAQSIARTYSDRVYVDPWEKVEDYRRVKGYQADHPNAGRVKVGRALELPASRVRGWLNDAVPDPVHAINTASRHGWLDPEPHETMAAALGRLLAHVMAGGSVTDTWVPSVSVGPRVSVDELQSAFTAVGVESHRRHEDASSRATEVIPRDDGAVLGRCLYCMGVPQGSKRDLTELPPALSQLPEEVRRAYARITVAHRGVEYETKATRRIMIERPRAYLDALAALIRDVTDEQATAGDRGVTVSAAAARDLIEDSQLE